tara:strand:- start:1014 stop:1322 length:309 start_codon:yes stop_codon:yes gene_type:complete
MKIFHLVADPGHSWLKVPMKELDRLGIADDISAYSYQKGDMAYLEEDCDAGVFIQARVARAEAIQIKEFNRQRQSKIRKYDAYTRIPVAAPVAAPVEEVSEA